MHSVSHAQKQTLTEECYSDTDPTEECYPDTDLMESNVPTTEEDTYSSEFYDPVSTVNPDYVRGNINISTTEYHTVVDQAIDCLLQWNCPPKVFLYMNRIVMMERDTQGKLKCDDLDIAKAKVLLSRLINFKKGTGDSVSSATPSTDLVKSILSLSKAKLPILDNIITTPVFSPSGALIIENGYYPESQIWLDCSTELRKYQVMADPSQEDIVNAKSYLMDYMLFDFPWDNQSSKTHALAFLLMLFMHDMISGSTPPHIISKPSPGCGATSLGHFFSIVYTGDEASVIPEGNTKDEIRKQITSALKAGYAFLFFDNVTNKVNSSALASFTTSKKWADRVLGGNNNFDQDANIPVLLNGNNPTFSPDMKRRLILISLVAVSEDPATRMPEGGWRCTGNPFQWISDNRPELVWSCLTLIQAWVAAGMPKGTKSKASYNDWAEKLSGLFDVIQVPGFLENERELDALSNPEDQAFRHLMIQAGERYAGKSFGAKDIVNLMQQSEIYISLSSYGGRDTNTQMGYKLRDNKDRIFGQYKLISAASVGGSSRYKLVPQQQSVTHKPVTEEASDFVQCSAEDLENS